MNKTKATHNLMANIVLLRGVLGAITERETTGGIVSEVSLRTKSLIGETSVRDDVPLVWTGDGSVFGSPVPGTEVVVSGRVRQRFFRSGGLTVSRTEVVVESLAAVTQRSATRRLTERAAMHASALATLAVI
jgi:hypothetical protein